MATKKSASKKAAPTTEKAAPAAEKTAVKAPAKVAAKKSAAKKPEEVKAVPVEQPKEATKSTKARPTHHDISVQAYLLWERDGKKHGHHDQYWAQAEKELHG